MSVCFDIPIDGHTDKVQSDEGFLNLKNGLIFFFLNYSMGLCSPKQNMNKYFLSGRF